MGNAEYMGLFHSTLVCHKMAERLQTASAPSVNTQQAMKLQFTRPRWVEDEEVTRCYLCKTEFGLLKRKSMWANYLPSMFSKMLATY